MKKNKGLPLWLYGMLTFEFWELHEACFILTQWPENMVGRGLERSIYERFGRGALYCPTQKLLLKELNMKTKKMISCMKESIRNRELQEIPVMLGTEALYGENTSYFLKVVDIIKWCLFNDFYLPEAIQDKYGLYQQNTACNSKPLQNSIKNKFLGQLIHVLEPQISISAIRNHELMKKFGAPSADKTRRAIHRDLLDVFKVKSGEKGEEISIDAPLEPIQEVVCKDLDGRSRYSFMSLKTILLVATRAKKDILGLKHVMKLYETDFLKEVMVDPCLLIYLRGATKAVITFCWICCLEEIESSYSHPKIQSLPWDIRKQMTIGALMEMNWDLCHEMFTEEEKTNLGICKPTF